MTVEQVNQHIKRDPAVLGGKPVIRGMRIPVSLIAGFVGAGDSVDEILDAYPVLTKEDIEAAVTYAEMERERARGRVS